MWWINGFSFQWTPFSFLKIGSCHPEKPIINCQFQPIVCGDIVLKNHISISHCILFDCTLSISIVFNCSFQHCQYPVAIFMLTYMRQMAPRFSSIKNVARQKSNNFLFCIPSFIYDNPFQNCSPFSWTIRAI